MPQRFGKKPKQWQFIGCARGQSCYLKLGLSLAKLPEAQKNLAKKVNVPCSILDVQNKAKVSPKTNFFVN
jgi:hypothetical protein